MANILEGIGLMFFGLVVFSYTYKNAIENDFQNSSMKGYIAGIGLIIIGLLTTVGYFK